MARGKTHPELVARPAREKPNLERLASERYCDNRTPSAVEAALTEAAGETSVSTVERKQDCQSLDIGSD